MFTGIVDHTASVHSVESHAGGLRLVLATRIHDPDLGESIAVDGVCLTVMDAVTESGLLSFDVSPETVSLTNMGAYEKGQSVHIERALRVGDRLGGHWVTGHVDGCVVLAEKTQAGEYLCLRFSGVPENSRHFCVTKGSIALAGISFTINTVTEDGFTIMCIPHTQDVTHCSSWQPGYRCHVEYDYLLKGAYQREESLCQTP